MARRQKSILEELHALFVIAPWWIGPIVATLVYLFLALALPGILRGQHSSTDTAAVVQMHKTTSQIFVPLSIRIAPWGAGVVLFIWLLSLIQKMNRRALFNKTRGINEVRELSWQKFEMLIGEYYRRRGFAVEERGGAKADGGVDIILRSGPETILVQCKHWKGYKVGVQPVRELLGVMTHRGASRGIFVTSGVFTQEALSFARSNRIELIDGENLKTLIQSVQSPRPQNIEATSQSPQLPIPIQSGTRDLSEPVCPKCGGPMMMRTAKKGAYAGSSFFGCLRYPACNGTINTPN